MTAWNEKIDDYLFGKLSPAEEQSFKDALEREPELREELEFRQKLRFVAQHQDLLDVYQSLREDAAQMPLPVPKKPWLKSWQGMMTVGVCLVLLSFLGYRVAQEAGWVQKKEQRLVLELAEPYLFGRNPSTEVTPYSQGMSAYEAGNYEQAILFLEQAPVEPMPQFCLGVSYLMTRQPEEALRVWDGIPLEELTDIEPVKRWYKALALLYLGREGEAVLILQGLQNDNTYGTKSQTLLKELL